MKKLGFLIVLAIGMFLTYMPANAQQTSSASVTTDVQCCTFHYKITRYYIRNNW